jgi:hypothetical protein
MYRIAPVVLVSLVLLAVPLGSAPYAADWYVSPSGSGTTCSSGSPCDLGYANANATAGTHIILKTGTYSTAIAPANSGSSITNRIVYRSETLDSSMVRVVPQLRLSGRSYVTVKNISFGGGLTLDTMTSLVVMPSCEDDDYAVLSCARDSIAHCSFTGNLALTEVDDCVISNCGFVGSQWSMQSRTTEQCVIDTCRLESWSERDTVINCRFDMTSVEDGRDIVKLALVRNSVISSNRVSGSTLAATKGNPGRKLFFFRDNIVRDNHWVIDNNCSGGGCDESGFFVLRDRSYRNLFQRDSVRLQGARAEIRLSQAGNNGGDDCGEGSVSAANPNTTFSNNYEYCIYINETGGDNILQDLLQADTLKFNTFASTANALNIYHAISTYDAAPAVVTHNTFASIGSNVYNGSFSTSDEEWTGEARITHNIFYCNDAATGEHNGAVYYYTPQSTSIDTVNWNLYAYYAADPIAYRLNGEQHSMPGTGDSWYADTGYDAGSLYGSPRFTDSTVAGFNGTPTAGSAAVGTQWPHGYVGAIYADVISPEATTDLLLDVGKNTAAMSWTAPGDDEDIGTADTYDLRYSTSTITSLNFASATQIATGAPEAAGTPECAEKGGLASCTTYYFALKTRDEAGNWSAMSNVVSSTTDCGGAAQVYCAGFRASPVGVAPEEMFAMEVVPTVSLDGVVGVRMRIPSSMRMKPVDLALFDASGRRVQRTRIEGAKGALEGHTWQILDGKRNRVPAGLYFVRAAVDGRTVSGRVVVLR